MLNIKMDKMKRFTKQILTVAVLFFAVLTANAQNKVFDKYADMKGVEFVTIGKSMLGDALDAQLAKRFDKMFVMNVTGKDARKKIAADIKKLSADKNYDVVMSGKEDDAKYEVLFNEKSSPSEFVISVSNDQNYVVMVFIGDFTQDDLDSLMDLMDDAEDE